MTYTCIPRVAWTQILKCSFDNSCVAMHICWFIFYTLAAGIRLGTSRLRQHRQLPFVQHVRLMPRKLCQKHNQSQWHDLGGTEQLTPVRNAQVSFSTPVCVHFEPRPGSDDIHNCWFNFDALAPGNAYKLTKEPIHYRGPSRLNSVSPYRTIDIIAKHYKCVCHSE